jgi:excisionase family DNA binding protein
MMTSGTKSRACDPTFPLAGGVIACNRRALLRNTSTVDEYFLMGYKRGAMGGTLRMEKFLSVAAAAELLGLHRTRINQLIDSGALPATRIGRSYAIREFDLEKVKDRPAPGRPAKEAGAKKTAAKKSKKGSAK